MSNTAQQIAATVQLAAAVTNGQLVQLSSTGTTLATTTVLGAVQTALPLASGSQAQVITNGAAIVRCVGSLTIVKGDTLYLSATAGYATNVAGGLAIGVVEAVGTYATTGLVTATLGTVGDGALVPTTANWPLTICRFYAVNYVSGVDTNKGYIDAAPGTVFTPAQLHAVAVKTIEQVQSMQPRQGAGRQMVTLIWGDKDAAAPIEYFRKDGTTRDWWDRSGYSGFVTNIVRASDFTNSSDDRLRMAGYIPAALAGPNDDSSWTVQSYAAPIVTNAAGSLPTFPSAEGAAVHWITGSQVAAGQGGAVKYVRSSSTFEISTGVFTILVPVANDTYILTRPSVQIATVIGQDTNANVPQSALGTAIRVYGTVFGGLEHAGFSPLFTNSLAFRANMEKITLVKCSFTGFSSARFTAGTMMQMHGAYLDEVGNNYNTCLAFHYRSPAALFGSVTFAGPSGSPGASIPGIACVIVNGDLAKNATINLEGVISLAANPLLQSSAIHGVLLLDNILALQRSNTALGGIGGGTAAGRLLIRGQSAIATGLVQVVGGVKSTLTFVAIGNASASAICVSGIGNHISLATVTQDTDVNAGYGLDLVGVVSAGSLNVSDNIITIGTGNTITGTLGDINLEAGDVRTWASISQGLVTKNNTFVTVQNQTVPAFRRVTIDTLANAPVLAADPSAPADGDIWIKNTGGVRTLNVRIAGATYATVLT